MRIFITAGNTQTPIDRVRCVTNIFTGRTGGLMAAEAHRRGHHVTLLTSHPHTVPLPSARERFTLMTYRTFDDLDALMARCITDTAFEAIIHCAAVSDYRCVGVYAPTPMTTFDTSDLAWQAEQTAPAMLDRGAGKIKGNEPELWLRLVRTPKIVDKIRTPWNFRGTLVKFKLEVGISAEELQAIAEKARAHSDADWMVANTLDEASRWALLGNAAGYVKVARADLPAALLDRIEKEGRHG